MTDNPGWASPSSSSEDSPDHRAAPDQARGTSEAPGGGPGATPPNWSKQQPPPADWSTPAWGGAPSGWAAGGGQGPWGQPPAAKPGVIPLRPLGVGEILDGAVSTMRLHWRTVLGVSLAVALITQALSTVVTWWMFNGLASEMEALQSNPNPSVDDVMNVFSGMFAGLGAAQGITVLGTIVVTAMLTMVVSRAVLGQPVTTADAWRDARPRLPGLLGLTLLLPLIGIGIIVVACVPGILFLGIGSEPVGATLLILGALAGLAVTVWLMVRLSLASPALMLEKQGVFKAMARSAKLVRGSWWRVFGILLLAAVITFIVSSIVQTPFSVLSLIVGGESFTSFLEGDSSAAFGLPALIVTGIGAAIGMTISFPISAGVSVLLYIDQRIRREALDLELARAAGVPGYDGASSTQPSAGTQTPGN